MAVTKPSKRGGRRGTRPGPREPHAARSGAQVGPEGPIADAQLRMQVRRDVLTMLVYGMADHEIAQALETQRNIKATPELVRALIAEARGWQQERHQARSRTSRADIEEMLELAIRTNKPSSHVRAIEKLARVRGVDAPIEVRHTLDLAPDVLAALGQSTQGEIAAAVQRALAEDADDD